MKKVKQFFAHRPLATVIMVGVAVLAPLMYSLSFIKSVWNPYGGARNLPVAVVNNDRAVEYQGRLLRVGDQTVDQLRKNHQLKWQFVNSHQAKEGMDNHRYYTVVTIPRDFSRHAASVMNHHPQKMVLKYQTNDSKNYLAETISEIGVGQLNSQIRSTVTKAYANVLFHDLRKLHGGMNQAADGAQQLSSGMAAMQDGTNRYVLGVSQVNNGLQTLQVKVTPLATVAKQMAAGGQRLADGVTTYTGAVGQLAHGLSTLAANSGTLNNGMSQFQGGLSTLSSNSKSLRQGAAQLDQGTQQLNGAVSQSMSQFDLHGIMQTMDQAQQLKANLVNLQNGLGQAQSALAAAGQSAQQLQATTGKLDSVAAQLGNLAGVAQNDGQIAQSNAAIAQKAKALADQTSDNNAKATLGEIAATAGQDAQVAKSNADTIKGMGSTLQSLNQLKTGLSTMEQQLGQLSRMQSVLASANTTMRQANGLLADLDGYRSTINGLSGTTDQLQKATQKIATGATTLNGGVDRYSRGVDQAAASTSQLRNGLGQYTTGVGQASAGASQLTANSGQLQAGAGQLAGALGQLNGQVPSLINGVNKLANGTQQLAANSPAMISGMGLLGTGAGRLSMALLNGAHQLNQQQPGKKTAGMFATPTLLKHSRYSRVPNYGHALAPFIMGTGLFIGVLIFTLEFPSSRILDREKNRLAVTLHELAVAVVTSVLMVIVQNAGLVLAGLHVQHPMQLLWIGICYTFAQMAIMQAFTIILGRFGTIIGLLLFVAQLGGAGGMFPMEVTNRFFNVIHPWLPMTYAINGFRQAITGGFGAAYVNSNALILLGFALVFYAILFAVAHPLQLRRQRKQQQNIVEA